MSYVFLNKYYVISTADDDFSYDINGKELGFLKYLKTINPRINELINMKKETLNENHLKDVEERLDRLRKFYKIPRYLILFKEDDEILKELYTGSIIIDNNNKINNKEITPYELKKMLSQITKDNIEEIHDFFSDIKKEHRKLERK